MTTNSISSPRLRNTLRGTALAAVFVLAANMALATILTFENDMFDGSTFLPLAYGDRVASATYVAPGNDTTWWYEQGVGFTPNIALDYQSPDGSTGFAAWAIGYGDLTDVLWYTSQTTPLAQIVLTPDSGYGVALHSFDLGGWQLPQEGYVRVYDAQDNVLFEYDTLSATPFPGLEGHWTYDGPTLVATDLLRIEWSTPWYIAIDNVSFSQVPEPGALSCLAASVALFVRRRRGAA